MPGRTIEQYPEADFEKLPWALAEARAFSADLLRIAVRHGVLSSAGIILDDRHTAELGWADELRSNQIALDQSLAELRGTASMRLIREKLPDSSKSDARFDEEVRQATEKVARRAEKDFAEVLAAPVQPELVEHWRRLGGHYPD
ncbi:hypothetical protein [Saccharopolyspora sp. NPDC050642]|uniref:hypothetical protein n=1 Tax=Saccharopolyspora sp. NPDC050642 TaxID=3157099 RepID=UPI0033CC0EEF